MIAAVLLASDGTENATLSHIIKTLKEARVDRVVIVVHSDEEKKNLAWFNGKIVVDDEKWNSRELALVVKGFGAMDKDDLHGILVCDGTQPNISRNMIVDLLQGFWKSQSNIVLVVMNGKRGAFPFILENSVVERLKTNSSPDDIEALVAEYPDEVSEVFFNDEGVV
jgi:CTP:molybdopterin cytidylyltransferase MocA